MYFPGKKHLETFLLEEGNIVKKNGGGTASFSLSERRVSDFSIEKLKAKMAPFVHVHKGTILLQSLPGLQDSAVLLNPPALQKHVVSRIKSQGTFECEHKVALASVHPSLLQHCTLSDNEMPCVKDEALEEMRLRPEIGVKTMFVVELIQLSVAKKEKVLILSQYVQPLELLRDQLAELFHWDDNQILQMGGGLRQNQRQLLISHFNDPDSGAKVMLASTRCCYEGISLVGASRIVMLDVVRNSSVARQAIS